MTFSRPDQADILNQKLFRFQLEVRSRPIKNGDVDFATLKPVDKVRRIALYDT
ncbi:hypothetical protein EBBID32_43900 [Sphingobium indicum BiD32]|uniref:Uncharacterized protein n=1 Tax=Sphingobium indicum BiD32 TaxID=1301087 RepID=N1MTD0_9SPHN|nr:hypothetical protein EBBID32_43900 [Sphingobium indicum BiD32]